MKEKNNHIDKTLKRRKTGSKIFECKKTSFIDDKFEMKNIMALQHVHYVLGITYELLHDEK